MGLGSGCLRLLEWGCSKVGARKGAREGGLVLFLVAPPLSGAAFGLSVSVSGTRAFWFPPGLVSGGG
jgi:hypothetical protein